MSFRKLAVKYTDSIARMIVLHDKEVSKLIHQVKEDSALAVERFQVVSQRIMEDIESVSRQLVSDSREYDDGYDPLSFDYMEFEGDWEDDDEEL